MLVHGKICLFISNNIRILCFCSFVSQHKHYFTDYVADTGPEKKVWALLYASTEEHLPNILNYVVEQLYAGSKVIIIYVWVGVIT